MIRAFFLFSSFFLFFFSFFLFFMLHSVCPHKERHASAVSFATHTNTNSREKEADRPQIWST